VATIEAADPVPGVRGVEPNQIAAGSFGAVAAGNEVPDRCEEGDDFCGRYGTGWSTTDGTTWMRLPRRTPLTDGWGGTIWPAGDAGVIANSPFSQSPNGWAWSPLAEPKDVFVDAFAIRGATAVAAGMDLRGDPPSLASTIWAGVVSFH
jgi:hypothetical protein